MLSWGGDVLGAMGTELELCDADKTLGAFHWEVYWDDRL